MAKKNSTPAIETSVLTPAQKLADVKAKIAETNQAISDIKSQFASLSTTKKDLLAAAKEIAIEMQAAKQEAMKTKVLARIAALEAKLA